MSKIGMNGENLWLKSGKGTNHALGYYGVINRDRKIFVNSNIEGHVFFGYGDGALGSLKGGGQEKIAMQWNGDGIRVLGAYP